MSLLTFCRHTCFLLLFSGLSLNLSFAQKEDNQGLPATLMFYNVENLFDVENDSLVNDEEFLPEGLRRWTHNRMKEKFRRISRVILNAGMWNPPVVVGLGEVENSRVLKYMLYDTGLANLGYEIVHYDSPDERGIDVAFLFLSSRFVVSESYPVSLEAPAGLRPTRDILYVKGVIDKADTLHFFVNHWPSRYSGAAATQKCRLQAARKLRYLTDSLQRANTAPHIVIMGDFNEVHSSRLFTDYVGVGGRDDKTPFYAPSLELPPASGTLKYRQSWQVFDQIIVSRTFLEADSKVQLAKKSLNILDFPFLLERDEVYGGQKPFRTYLGMKYHGGYSDHLPVSIELNIAVPPGQDE